MANSTALTTDLLEEMIIEILLWLPVISLLRFRAVSKAWKSLISNPYFIKRHLERAAANKNSSIMFSSYSSKMVSVFPTHLRCPENAVNLRLPPPFTGYHIVGSCNGIFCLGEIFDDVLSIWNPSTRQYKCLPEPLFQNEDPSTTDLYLSLGFGYDSLSSDYKVVRMVTLTQGTSEVQVTQHTPEARVELYSANANSWREIQVQKPKMLMEHFSTIVKEVLYWYAVDRHGVVSFDLRNEVFGFITFPSFVKQAEDYVEVVEFKASLAMILYSRAEGSMRFELSLWTMDAGRGNLSWTKKFKYLIATDICYVNDLDVYERLRAGQFLATRMGGFFVYGDSAEVIKNAGTTSQDNWNGGIYSFTQSLVSLEGFNQVRGGVTEEPSEEEESEEEPSEEEESEEEPLEEE